MTGSTFMQLLRLAENSAFVEKMVQRLLPESYRHMPAMLDHAVLLDASKLGVSAEIKAVLAEYAESHGCILDIGDDGNPIIQRKKAVLTGAMKLAGWVVWDEVQRCKKILSLCTEYEGYSLDAAGFWRCMHPLTGADSITLRCASQAPKAQNLLLADANPPVQAISHLVVQDGVFHVHHVTGPVVQLAAEVYQDCLDPENLEATAAALAERFDLLQFWLIVCAFDEYQLVSVDQAQVELRSTAALGKRVTAEAEKALSRDFVALGWVVAALRRCGAYIIVLVNSTDGFDGFRDQLAATWRPVRQHGSPLAEVFRRGVDPHLLTGLAMAAREGVADLAGHTPVEVLSDPATDVKALKGKLKAQRQNAKPANFGLLYGAQAPTLWRLGVTDYGLDWSLEDATAVRALWLEQYADVRFWQLWVQFVHCSGKFDTVELYLRNRYTMELETKSYKVRTSRTLGGRPIYTPELREVLNHQDQSSGAEIMTRAIVSMPGPARSYLCNAVHDELIAICPTEEAHAVGQQIRQAMRDAMDALLAPWSIPSDADVGTGQFWTKV